jgi:N-methylhydantoinase A
VRRARRAPRPAARRTRPAATRVVAPSAIGVDTGGTFTDFVALRGGRLVAFKLASTPRAAERAVLEGLTRLGATRDSRVRHGSTVATNALLERKGARVALLTTQGFEDLLEIGRQDRPDLYALDPHRLAPLVPASRRIGVVERIGPRGERWRTLSAAAVRRAVGAVRARRPAAVAIGLLHAYAWPAHERRLARALAPLGIPVTCSSVLAPEYREYERLATTVTNAYLAPRVAGYLRRLARGTRARLEVVLSHGGTAPPAAAAREPVRQLLSGPAAGLKAARDVARSCGWEESLTIDVGGTSTDCAFVAGELPRRRGREVAGFPVLLPLLDVHTVGAGGGSIARVDAGGLLHVGPESAGADPGPACYGRGGPATVTDALVVLGRIAGETLAGGALKLERRAAHAALAALGRALGGGDALAAAEGVVALADAHMEAALRRVSVERGHDPRGAALVAFGGAGGLHACALAAALGAPAVLAPRHAGVLSALGALTGGSRRERSRTVLLDARDHAALERAWRRLEREVRAEFTPAERTRVRVERWAEVRYRGQSHELSLAGGADLAAAFHLEHLRRFGFAEYQLPVEVVTLEARGSLPGDRVPATRSARRAGAPIHRVRVRVDRRWARAPVWAREQLPARFATRGPAIVVEDGATLWIAPGWSARSHASGTLILTRGRG